MIAQLREAVSLLSTPDRADLAVDLLDRLDVAHHWVNDEGVARRQDASDSRAVRGQMLAGFKTACGS